MAATMDTGVVQPAEMNSRKVQNFIKKNHTHLSIGITIDGTRKKHDLNRIWKGNGPERGSYDDVVKNIPLWLNQFPDAATKVTISHNDIPYICESVMKHYGEKTCENDV